MEDVKQLILSINAEMERSGRLGDSGGGEPYYEIDAVILESALSVLTALVEPPVPRVRLTTSQKELLISLHRDVVKLPMWAELNQGELRTAKVLERHKYLVISSDSRDVKLTSLGIEEARRLSFKL